MATHYLNLAEKSDTPIEKVEDFLKGMFFSGGAISALSFSDLEKILNRALSLSEGKACLDNNERSTALRVILFNLYREELHPEKDISRLVDLLECLYAFEFSTKEKGIKKGAILSALTRSVNKSKLKTEAHTDDVALILKSVLLHYDFIRPYKLVPMIKLALSKDNMPMVLALIDAGEMDVFDPRSGWQLIEHNNVDLLRKVENHISLRSFEDDGNHQKSQAKTEQFLL